MIRLEKLSRKFQVGNQVVHALDEVDLEINTNDYVLSWAFQDQVNQPF